MDADRLRRLLPLHKLFEREDYEEACAHAPGSFTKTDLGRVHAIKTGDGPPLLLLHGFLYSTLMWEPVAPKLSDHFTTHNIDLLGWGYSARDESIDYNYALYADQVLHYMDANGIERASIVGQSMGGGTAIRFAVEHRDRVDKLVLVDPASLPNPLALPGQLFALPIIGELAFAMGQNAVIAKNLKDLWFHQTDKVTDDYVARVATPLRIKGSTYTLLNILRKLDFGSQTDYVQRLARADVPVMLVWGREDKAVPFNVGLDMHEMLPNAPFVVIDDAGHTPHEEEPEAFLEAVVPFLVG